MWALAIWCLATQHRANPTGDDAELLVDIDLVILAALQARYHPRSARSKILKEFLAP
jgi:predicted metal-dependent HD superfamily phosphohydrolase